MRTTCTARSPMIITVVATGRARWRWRSRYPRVFFLAEFTSTISRILIAVLRDTANPHTNHARRCRLAADAEHLAGIALAIALPVLASLPITFLSFLGILIDARLIILPHIASNVRGFRRHRRRIAAQVRHLPIEGRSFSIGPIDSYDSLRSNASRQRPRSSIAPALPISISFICTSLNASYIF